MVYLFLMIDLEKCEGTESCGGSGRKPAGLLENNPNHEWM